MKHRLPKILLIDDDPRIVRVLTLTLTDGNYHVISATNGKDGLKLTFEERPDLILLDIRMQGMDGFEVLDHLRSFTEVPVIFLTSAADDGNRIRGMEKGATDVIDKHTSNEVLLAHIANRLRMHTKNEPHDGPRFVDNDLEIDVPRRVLRFKRQDENLTPLQWRLMKCLLEREGQITSQQDLLAVGWGDSDFRELDRVKVQISQIRKKLHDSPRKSRYLHTMRNEGYMFEPR